MHSKILKDWFYEVLKRMRLLKALESLRLEDAWIAAGFLRSLAGKI